MLIIAVHLYISVQGQSNHILWFDEPATFFEESLVLGNGKMGASVFSGISTEKIFLNDATFWSGEPVNTMMNPEAYKNIPEIREALANENYKLADELYKKVQGSFSESYAPIGTLHINFNHGKTVKGYNRELNISNAVAKAQYQVGKATYGREYFVSHPEQVIAIQYTSDVSSSLGFKIEFESEMKYEVSNDRETMIINGYAPYHAEPIYNDVPNPVLFDKNRGTRFTTLIKITDTDGKIKFSNKGLSLSKASKATVLVSIATSFNGFDKNPATEGKDNRVIASNQLREALLKNYQEIKERHIKDYQSLFNRVTLDLGETGAPNLPTDERLMRYAKGEEDKNLETLYFQFGRYLLISSSRTTRGACQFTRYMEPVC